MKKWQLKKDDPGALRGESNSSLRALGSFGSSDPVFRLIIGLYSQAGPADLKHFDPEFTQEAVSKSIGHSWHHGEQLWGLECLPGILHML